MRKRRQTEALPHLLPPGFQRLFLMKTKVSLQGSSGGIPELILGLKVQTLPKTNESLIVPSGRRLTVVLPPLRKGKVAAHATGICEVFGKSIDQELFLAYRFGMEVGGQNDGEDQSEPTSPGK